MNFESWQVWAVLSAVFAALTAIFAKAEDEGFPVAPPVQRIERCAAP
jgi:uncharacterized membrane protein